MSKFKTEIAIDIEAAAGAEVETAAAGYASPALVTLGTAVKLVQGAGASAGYDCHYGIYRTPGPWGC